MVALYDEVRVWTKKGKHIWTRLQATVLALASLGFIWFVIAGKLLRFGANY